MQIPGYSHLKRRCEGSRCTIYEAQRQDGMPVILKVLREPYPSSQEVARFRREYEITQQLEAPGIISCFELIQTGSQFAIALEDFGGQALSTYLGQPPLPLDQALSLMKRIADIVDQVHQGRVIHRDINPTNIVWNPDSDILKLIDFGIASQLSRETSSLSDLSRLEGTLPYISPEQTGRMNRAVDYRTDFYSLGVTFYQLLTGQIPFTLDDPLDLIHAHIARLPVAPHVLRPEIPTPLSEIVLKLMAKTADERYQSAYGLAEDLRRCDRSWRAEGRIPPFELSQQDFSDRLIIPQTLYGRESEYQQLMAAFERCCQGQVELVMVTGYSGIGKTALVNEIHQPVTRARGEFISGKYDQFSRGEPYRPLVSAIAQLVQRLLCRSDTEIAQYRQQLLAAVGSNVPLLIELVPEFKQLLGPQPPLSATPDTDTETRLHVLFRRLLAGLATADHPLVLFIDDLQWADAAFVRLLKRLATDPEGGYLLLLGTYRNNEVNAAHPLMLGLDEIRQAGRSVPTLTLGPLQPAQVQQLLQDTLHLSAAEVAPLADLCQKRTQGNPFFLNQLLERFYAREWLWFEPERRQWTWDWQRLQSQGVTDDIITFLIDRMGDLSEATVATLQRAAVVGNSFDLSSLTALMTQSPAQVVQHLQPALQQELILLADSGLDLSTSFDFQADSSYNPSYRFIHDRVQQAAYSLLNPADRVEAHYHLGQGLWDDQTSWDDEQLFATVHHLNQAQTQLTATERQRLAELNLQAGNKAIQAAAFQAALELLLTAVNLLPADAWESSYEMTLKIHSEASRAAYLATDLKTMERLNQVIFEQARQPLDAVSAHESTINTLIGQNQLNAAIDYTLEILRRDWNESLPSHPSSLQVLVQFLRTKLALVGKSPAQLAALPDVTDRAMQVSMSLRQGLFSATYYARPNLLPVLALSLVRSSLRQGIGPESPMAFSVMGLVQASLGDEAGGYQLGQTACHLIPRIDDLLLRNRAWHVFNSHLRFWKEPYAHSQEGLREVYKQGLECGDLEYAAFGAMMTCAISFYRGNPLEPLKQEMTSFSSAIHDLGQGTSLYTHEMHRQAVFNLTGDCDDPSRLVGDAYNEDEAVPIHLQKSDIANLNVYYGVKAMMHLLLGDYEQAAAAAETNRQYLNGAVATVFVPTYFIYDALSLAQVCSQRPHRRRAILRRIRRNRRKVAHWAAMSPMNYDHYLTLIDAELARLQQRPYQALAYYEQAIAAAQQNGYLHTEALSSELAGRFLLSRDQTKLASTFLRDACYLYRRWGAQAKVERLEQEYPDLRPREKTISTTGSSFSTSTTTSTSNSQLDFESVIRSSQALSNEIVLERLLQTLMKTVLATAGAEVGLLLLERQDTWQVVAADVATDVAADAAADGAADGANQDQAETPAARVLAKGKAQFSRAMVNYVAKTGESLVLKDASREGMFTNDPYVQTYQPKAVLCTPLMTQGQLKGILYLENNLAAGAFTPERVEVLQILSGQAAISLQNAQLYTDLEQARDQLADYSRTLEQKVDERTQELSQTLEVLKATQAELRFENDLLRSAEASSSYTYQVGGSLPMDAPTYVVRSADRYLYKALRQGQFCYVLNSRQMGKSSLMVRMLQQLQQDGYSCTAIDLTLIGSETATPEQWYKGLAVQLWQGFDLLGRFNLKAWWNDHLDISPVQRLGQFIRQVLLAEVGQDQEPNSRQLVIFLDEIDSVLGLPFSVNDFFGLIRACYNQRSLDASWQRLTFGFFGVATPGALITDSQRTPFNIGRAIPLEGFKEHEAQPLLNGLAERVDNPQTLLKALLYWTNGQPFLTQKLCQIIGTLSEPIPAHEEAAWVENLVRTRVIENWEDQDEPEHLRTVCDRILNGPRPADRLLHCYHTILTSGGCPLPDSADTEELLLSGLVTKQQGQFQVNNRIYAAIFNPAWVARTLTSVTNPAQYPTGHR